MGMSRRTVILAVFALVLAGMIQVSMATPVVYQGIDFGATSLATAPNSLAASNAFDAATGPLNIIDFDTNTTGATLSPASFDAGCGFTLCGGNTTSGGSQFYGAVWTTTITFDSPIDAFGAYFSGWQRNDQIITYSDGGIVSLAMPAGSLSEGGMVFFGFIDPGASITSITYSTALGDYVAIDDMRFGTTAIPEPTSLLLFGTGLGVLGLVARRRR
jgi:hypothetical protein